MEYVKELGATAGVVAAILLFLKYMTDQNAAQAARDALFAKSLDKLTEANERVASATERAAQEAKDRNGHLAEIAAENQQATMQALERLSVKEQHVDKQVVESQEVKR